nr:amiloride sensitive cation channel 5 [Hymenolepis microstoma]
MNKRGKGIKNFSTVNRDQLAADRANVEDGRYFACSNLDNQLTSDYSRIANYTAQRPEFYNPKKGKKNQRLIYIAAACGASFLRFSRRSTMHGLNHLSQARTAQRRLFWLCISIAALFGFFFNMFFLVEKYVQVPVLTNVLHDSDNFIYPDVTFCTINPIYFPPEGTTEFERMIAAIEKFKQFKRSDHPHVHRLELADYLFVERNTYYVHPKWLTIVECQYMQTPCSYKHFDEKILWPYGACYTFNATKMLNNMTREIITRNRFNRFRPDFKIIVYKALDMPEKFRMDPHGSVNVPSGILLMIHEPGTYPHIGHSSIVDECTQIELRMTYVKHLTKLGKCVPEREYISYVNTATNKSQIFLSSQPDCLDAAVQTALAENCGCQMHTMPVMYKYHHLPFCFSDALNFTFIESCFSNVANTVDKKHCFRDVCEHFTIDRVVAHTKFPAIEERHNYHNWLRLLARLEEREEAQYKGKSDIAKLALNADFTVNPNLTIKEVLSSGNTSLLNHDFVNRNFMMLRIVPASLFMDRVEETEEYPFSRLLSDIGGCVGLWVGASLITLFEFADLILDCVDLGNIGFPNVDDLPVHDFQKPRSKYNNSNEKVLAVCEKSNFLQPNRSLPTTPQPTTHEELLIHQSKDSTVIGNDQSHLEIENNVTSVKMIPLFYLPNQQIQEQKQNSPCVKISNPV